MSTIQADTLSNRAGTQSIPVDRVAQVVEAARVGTLNNATSLADCAHVGMAVVR